MIRTQPPAESSPAKARRYFRSIRLERDFQLPEALVGYTLTPQVRQILSRIAEGLAVQSSDRAITLTGPYGSGKSAFALFLAYLLQAPSDSQNPAYRILEAQDATLQERFSQLGEVALLPVVLTLRRASLSQALLEGLLSAAKRIGASGNLAQALETDLGAASVDTRHILKRLVTLSNLACTRGYRGVLLVLDELGKALEYAARHESEDIYLLQEIAELAARSDEQPLLVLGVLHQAFEQYGEHLTHAARKEWAKIQGRFSDIAFIEPPEQQIRLAAQATIALGIQPLITVDALESIARSMAEVGYAPKGLKPEDFLALAIEAAPLHPTVLVALPYLFRRFAQSERSLFAYLLSQEPFALQERIQQAPERLVRLPDLFDYFMTNHEGSLLRQSYARRWLEVADAIGRTPDLSPLEVDVLKTVGLLNILGDLSPLQATRELIALSLSNSPNSPEVEAALDTLQTRSLLTFRLYNRTYRVWEGSDVDIEAELEQARRKTVGLGLAETLQQYLPHRPLVARRHSHQSGALRFFAVHYLDAPPGEAPKPSLGADGLLACCLPATLEQAEAFRNWAKGPSASAAEHLLVVLPLQIGGLREAAAELRALRWVWDNTPALRDDRVARKELAERIALVEQSLGRTVEILLDPRPEPAGAGALWFYRGQEQSVSSPSTAAQLLSRVMDQLYPYTPRIKNELIYRRSLSSAAAAARRNLVERMLLNAHEPLLGMEGYPPERSMYESVLRVSGLHQDIDGVWHLLEPKKVHDPCNLRPAWEQMYNRIFATVTEPYPVDKLSAELEAPPYGVMPGVLPVLLAAFLLTYPDETSLYKEGVFVPEAAIVDFEVLMRRPELFAVGGSRILGERKAVVERLARGLKVKPALLPVVRALVRMVRSIPESARRTRKLPEAVLKLREAFERARSPERLLFHDLPLALGEKPFSERSSKSVKRIEAFFEKLNQALQTWGAFAPSQVEKARDILLLACGLPQGPEGWARLREQAKRLVGKPLHSSLIPLVNMLTVSGEETAVLEGVLALVASRPPKSWSDPDIERFPEQAWLLGERFMQAVHNLGVLTPEEEAWSEALAQQIRQGFAEGAPPHVLRAALARLLQEL